MVNNATETTNDELREENIRLKAEIQQIKEKKFGLIWEYKNDDKVEELKNSTATLVEDETKRVITNPDSVNHILINGDNYQAMTALKETHNGKVDVIYIDPPYNTGSRDFIYNDKFVDTEDGYRHSSWLSFMKNRLTLAKELLSNTGVIFVSIDDNEQARLKLLMDEVFGANKFLSCSVWEKGNAQNDAKGFQRNHEYVLAYGSVWNIGDSKETYLPLFHDIHGYYTKGSGLVTGGAGGALNARPFMGATLYYNPTTNDVIPKMEYDTVKAKLSNSFDNVYDQPDETLLADGYTPIYPPKKGKKLGRWTWGFDKFVNEKHRLMFNKTKTGYSVVKKDYLSEEDEQFIVEDDGKKFLQRSRFVPLRSVTNVSSGQGSVSIMKIFGEQVFNNSKPIELVKGIIKSHKNANAVVLDFFAGSGTTAHAVAELNQEDGGKRQCILITDGGRAEAEGESSKNSNGNAVHIAEEITYERIKRVLTGENWGDGKEHEPLGGNLKYYNTVLNSKETVEK